MPLFVDIFSPGDKIYGLASVNLGRNKYIDTIEFRQKFGHLDFTTDQLNNRFLGTGFLDGPSIYYSALIWGIEGTTLNITEQQSQETDQFRQFLENHPKVKYRPSGMSSGLDRNLRISRACKAALEFMTVKCGRRIHFILDDIDLFAVMGKTPCSGGNKSITGQELRYIYRNCVLLDEEVEDKPNHREEARKEELLLKRLQWNYYQKMRITRQMLKHITFWFKGDIVDPPWSSGLRRDVWFEYYGRYYEDKLRHTRRFIKKIEVEYKKIEEDKYMLDTQERRQRQTERLEQIREKYKPKNPHEN